jgi:hypothetical protein
MPPFDPMPLAELSAAELRRLVGELRAEVMRLGEAAVRLQEENAALKAEVARLKGLPGRPRLKPSGMEPATEPGRGRTRRERLERTAPVVSEEQVLRVAAPAGSRFKGGACPRAGQGRTRGRTSLSRTSSCGRG